MFFEPNGTPTVFITQNVGLDQNVNISRDDHYLFFFEAKQTLFSENVRHRDRLLHLS